MSGEKGSEEAIINCWPYTAPADRDQGDDHDYKGKVKGIKSYTGGLPQANSSMEFSDPVTKVTAIFLSVWVVTMLLFLHVNIGGFWWLLKALPFLILPLYALRRGLTHIRINKSGIVLESTAGKKVLRQTFVSWFNVQRIYIQPAPPGRPLLAAKMVVELSHGRKVVPLKKIATAGEWHKLVGALKFFSTGDKVNLDATYLDSLGPAVDDATSYTKLWLEALHAPPRRERLLPLTAGTVLQEGRFRIESKLGTGGQGSAYLAVMDQGEKVVLKEYILPVYVDKPVRKQAIASFHQEASTLSQLHDDHIIAMIDSFIEDQRAYLVLEYVQGPSLRQLVKANGPLANGQCLLLAGQMCAALKVLHEQAPPVVHQDFTPDNLILDAGGTLKLIDFMVAKHLVEGDAANNTVVGKHHYMPPEQFQGKATTQSDLYAFGATLYYLLTGEDPEPMSPAHPIVKNHNVSVELDWLVSRATQLDCAERYKSVAEIESYLVKPRG